MLLGYKYPRTRDLGLIRFQTVGSCPLCFSLKSERGSPSSTTQTQISTLHWILLTPKHPILAGSSSIRAGKASRYSFKILVDRSLDAFGSTRNALGNHIYIHHRTSVYDLVEFCWINLLVHEFLARFQHPSVVPTLCR
jgi:hypothetical protein